MTSPPQLWLHLGDIGFPLWLHHQGGVPEQVVILSHGLTNDHNDAPLFEDLREALRGDERTIVVDFDYPGSGIADGRLVDKRLSVLRAALRKVFAHVRAELGDHLPVAVVGRSIGGSVALAVSPETRPERIAVMSPPFELVVNLGALRGPQSAEGVYPLPPWAQPSGQVKGEVALSAQFYDELESEERRLKEAVRGAGNVFLISSTEDPKVRAWEMDALWDALRNNPSNQRAVLATDHNYDSVRGEVTRMLTDWLRR